MPIQTFQLSCLEPLIINMDLLSLTVKHCVVFRSSPKEHRRSTQPVSTDNEDSEDETGKLTHSPDSKVLTTVDGIDNHDEFTRYSCFEFSNNNIIIHVEFSERNSCHAS